MLRHAGYSNVDFVFVMILFYDIWPKILLRSLRRYSDNEIILVNHLGRPVPEDYYDTNCIILENKGSAMSVYEAANGRRYEIAHYLTNSRSHGAGIDLAVHFLRERGDRYMVHIEPDCVVYGLTWLDELTRAAKDGAIMAGPMKLSFGPIHPCPSIWDLYRLPGSFDLSQRSGFINHNVFNYVGMCEWLINTKMDDGGVWLWTHWWDCGILNWYKAALMNKAVHTKSDHGFKHFFGGRLRSPVDLSQEDLRLVSEFYDKTPYTPDKL